jgi:radical SAM superfamily enzyme YgiQ (UPF0313 family)
MNVLIIYPVTPPEIFRVEFNIGIASISACLKKAGHKTSLLCIWKFEEDKVEEKIKNFNPKLIAFSTVSDQFELTKEIVKFIHANHKIPIIIGGTHAMVAPEECIELDGVIGVCIGEGEEAIVELANYIEKEEDYSKVRNFWIKKDGKIIKNPQRPLIKDLDALPFPDRELFKGYIDTSNEIEFMGARGCPYQCSYCINKVLQNSYGIAGFVRYRSVDNLIKEIKEVLSKYRSPKILFHDDTFTLNKKWLSEFAEKYPKEIRLPYIANGRVETLNEDIIQLLKSSGCIELKIGVESGNEKIRREVLKRNMSNEQIINAFRLCRKYGILATSFNMIGIPGESEKEIKDTIELNKKIKPFRMGVSIFRPYKGTELYNLCKKNGWISNRKVVSYFEEESILDLPTISHKRLIYYYKIFKLSVYHPILVQFVKALIFIGIYDPLVKVLLALRRFVAKQLSREQKDFLMKILKI